MSLSTAAKLMIAGSFAVCVIIFIVIIYIMFVPAVAPVAAAPPAFVPTTAQPTVTPTVTPVIKPVVAPVIKPTAYVGCYVDKEARAMPMISEASTLSQCKQLAVNKGLSVFGLQYGNAQTGVGQCFGGNSLSDAQRYGLATNCKPLASTGVTGAQMGDFWSNAIYTV